MKTLFGWLFLFVGCFIPLCGSILIGMGWIPASNNAVGATCSLLFLLFSFTGMALISVSK